MTTPDPISDLLAALDRQPHLEAALRQRLLTEELLQLPQQVAELANTVATMATVFEQRTTQLEIQLAKLSDTVSHMATVFDQRLTKLEAQQASTNEGLDRIDQRFDRTDERLDQIDQRFDRTDERLDQIDQRFDRTDERLDQIDQRFDRTDERLDQIDQRFDRTDERLDQIDQRFDRTDERLDQIDQRFDRTDERLDRMDQRFDRIEAKQDTMQGDISAVHGQLSAMEGRQDSMQSQLNSLQGQVDNIAGSELERRVVRRAPRLALRHLGMIDAQVLAAINRPNGTTITQIINTAARRNIITDDQADELDAADIILGALSATGEPVYAVVEVSATLHSNDIARAGNRAAILNIASGVTTYAAAVGQQISIENQEFALAKNVTVVLLSSD